MIPADTKAVQFAVNIGAVLLGSVLFVAAFPNSVFDTGFPVCAYAAYIPVFWLIHRVRFRTSFFWGALYGYTAFSLFNYWLSVFHPLAGSIVGLIYLVYFALFFPVLKLAVVLCKKKGYVVQWLLWIVFEYLRTQGFLGYPYGITGYSQWQVLPIIQIAAIFGVWGVSALVIFPSAYIAAGLAGAKGLLGFVKREWLCALLWILALSAALLYGAFSPIDYSNAPHTAIALIQHNTDPWRGGIAEYRKNYEVLKRLSDEALKGTPKPDLVVWSETAFVPRIYWHQNYRKERDSVDLVVELLDYLSRQEVPFLIGNDDARRDAGKNPFDDNRVDYNAAMLFVKGELKQQYRKLHLVPFTEHFPYEKQLPFVYKMLKNADTHFWEKGTEETVFESNGIKFSSPICFEDTFGYLSRAFVKNGAELIVNISNDAWSQSLPAQNQHLSMAVFRAVENRRSMVRSTASGQTCGIDPNGKIVGMAAPFSESYLTVTVPVLMYSSFYTRHGDILPLFCIGILLFLLLIGGVRYILYKLYKPKHNKTLINVTVTPYPPFIKRKLQ
ncbi:apolipoprotein N-acyltransferase [Breznakiellaceae bacterium SP9]